MRRSTVLSLSPSVSIPWFRSVCWASLSWMLLRLKLTWKTVWLVLSLFLCQESAKNQNESLCQCPQGWGIMTNPSQCPFNGDLSKFLSNCIRKSRDVKFCSKIIFLTYTADKNKLECLSIFVSNTKGLQDFVSKCPNSCQTASENAGKYFFFKRCQCHIFEIELWSKIS
jgi:hypothetical protein